MHNTSVYSRQKHTGKLPHACQQLGQSSVAECETDNDVRDGDAACAGVVEGEDKCRRGERHQTKRGRVGELAVENGDCERRVTREGSVRTRSRCLKQGEGTSTTYILAAKGQMHGLPG
jgi:hypothetical protein